jgi:YkoY family integral membrane protein
VLDPCQLLAYTLYGQEIQWGDLSVIGLLIVLEGVLSIDNALVLGLLAKRLPPHQRTRALTYGLVGAFVFRFVAVATATYLLQWRWVKLIGGGYLVFIAVKHLFFESQETGDEEMAVDETGQLTMVDSGTRQAISDEQEILEIKERVPMPVPESVVHSQAKGYAKFWPTVLVIEFTDIAFAVDSILAAIALVGAPPADHPAESFHPKLWVVISGGLMGVVLMRFAAAVFIRLLERFPRFETAAYLLVIVIGSKLLVDWGFNSAEHPHVVDFHDWQNPAFWVFWGLMALSFCVGFLPSRKKSHA